MGEEGLNQMGESTFQVMKSVLSLTKIVCKTENNKNMLARHGMVQVLKEIVTSKPFLSCLEANCTLAHKLVIQQVLYEGCSTMRGMFPSLLYNQHPYFHDEYANMISTCCSFYSYIPHFSYPFSFLHYTLIVKRICYRSLYP